MTILNVILPRDTDNFPREKRNIYQQTRIYPYPLGAGSARPNPKMGAPDPENPLFLRLSVLRGLPRPWSQTMVSEGARPWGRGRSGDCEFRKDNERAPAVCVLRSDKQLAFALSALAAVAAAALAALAAAAAEAAAVVMAAPPAWLWRQRRQAPPCGRCIHHCCRNHYSLTFKK